MESLEDAVEVPLPSRQVDRRDGAAVEVYNKPRFSHREESFSILAVNAWELLLKARLLQITGNQLAAILEYERRQRADGSQSKMLYRKKNRSGNCVTVGLFKAHDCLVSDYGDTIPSAVRTNLEGVVGSKPIAPTKITTR